MELCWQSNVSAFECRLVITFLPSSKRLLISWLQSPSAMILEPPKIKSATVSTGSPSISHEVMWPDAMILVFWMLIFKATFSLSSFTFIKWLFSSLLSAIRVVSSAYLRLLILLAIKSWTHPLVWNIFSPPWNLGQLIHSVSQGLNTSTEKILSKCLFTKWVTA